MTKTTLRAIAYVCCWLMVSIRPVYASGAADGIPPMQLQPNGLIPKVNSEYFSSIPDAKVQIPVNIWGEVPQPGLHFLPKGTTVLQSISLAGGPTSAASLPEVRVFRGGEVTYVDLLGGGGAVPVRPYDSIYLDRSIKSDLPLIFSLVTTVVSVGSLYLVAKRQK